MRLLRHNLAVLCKSIYASDGGKPQAEGHRKRLQGRPSLPDPGLRDVLRMTMDLTWNSGGSEGEAI